MSKLTIEQCSETGICSILREGGGRVDLMPDEVDKIRQASGDAEALKTVLSAVDGKFAGSLEADELNLPRPVRGAKGQQHAE